MTLTNARKEIFQLADKALNGTRVEFLYKGVVFTLVPDTARKTKLDSLISEKTIAPGVDLEAAQAALSAEVMSAWDKKWDDL